MRLFLAGAAMTASALVGCSGSSWGVVQKLDTGRHVGVSSDRLARRM